MNFTDFPILMGHNSWTLSTTIVNTIHAKVERCMLIIVRKPYASDWCMDIAVEIFMEHNKSTLNGDTHLTLSFL